MTKQKKLIAPNNAGRLDIWLSEQFEFTRSRFQTLIKTGLVLVNERHAKPSYTLKGGERIDVTLPDAPSTDIVPEDMTLDIQYMDADLLVVNKPAGMVVHPAEGHPNGTLANGIVHLVCHMEGADPKRPGIVHRIDKGTSGLLVVARTERAMQCLSKQFATHTIHRRYLALIWGDKHPDEGTLVGAIGRSLKDRKKMSVRDDGKHAITHFKTLHIGRPETCKAGGGVSLMECRLETGRTHQIRVHMATFRQPIVGDPTYGLKKVPNAAWRSLLRGTNRQLLHAWQLGFTHPNGKRLHFKMPPPDDFERLLKATQIPFPV